MENKGHLLKDGQNMRLQEKKLYSCYIWKSQSLLGLKPRVFSQDTLPGGPGMNFGVVIYFFKEHI